MKTPLPSLRLTKRTRDIIVIGAPVGGGAAMSQIVASFPLDLGASIFMVLHSAAKSPILLADVLNAPGRLRATEAINGETVEQQRIYVAADGKHLTLTRGGSLRLSADRPACRYCPSIDALFSSAAEVYGARVIGVLLLHPRCDGMAGLRDIRNAGGRNVIQRDEGISGDRDEACSRDLVNLADIGARILSCVRGDQDEKPD